MNKGKRIATIKTVVALGVMLLGILFQINIVWSFKITISMSIISFLIGILLTSFINYNSLYNHLIITNPMWTDTLNVRNPLTIIQFVAFLLFSYGTGSLIGGLFQSHKMNLIGIVFIIGGIGVLLGMYLTLRCEKNKNK